MLNTRLTIQATLDLARDVDRHWNQSDQPAVKTAASDTKSAYAD